MGLFGHARRRARSLETKKTAYQFGFELCEERFLLTAYVVNSAADDFSVNTLRYVLDQLSITGTATNTIDFAIGSPGSPATINLLLGDLPAINRQVTINGLSQGGPGNTTVLVQINQNGYNALRFDPGSQGSVTQGLSIYSASSPALFAVSIDTDNVTLTGNYLGVQANGTTTGPNTYGVLITGSNNTVNGSNIIGGNSYGVFIAGSGTTANVVTGNFIGTNASGADLGNTVSGVSIVERAHDNTVGPGNTIGFNDEGIHLGSGATANVVLGNFIGTNASGANLGNHFEGVRIEAPGNTVGAGNTIGFNDFAGVHLTGSGATANVVTGNFIGTNASGANLGNGSYGVLVDNQAASNTVGAGNTIGFNPTGVGLGSGATANIVTGNFIGTNASNADLGNTQEGVRIGSDVSNNTIGPNNVIGFNQEGIYFDVDAHDNTVSGNYIGTNASGANLGNDVQGVNLYFAHDNTIGPGNTVGFNGNGVNIGSGATGNVVTSNFIGTNASGANLGNTSSGVYIDSTSNNTVGPNNTIGFGPYGVHISGSGATANVVTSNFIGTNASGANLGNTLSGVKIDSRAYGNTVGSGNTIGFGFEHGVHIIGSGTTDNTVTGNYIGTNASGANLGNGIDGVRIETLASGNTVGPGNTIGFSVFHAIHINDGADHNEVLGNYLGTNASGANLGNLLGGVYLDGSSNNLIGMPGQGNLISGNGGSAIQILGGSFTGSSYPSDGNVIQNNRIGTDWQVAAARPNGIGVEVRGAANTQIGGLNPGEGNWISGNTVAGISITGLESTGTSIVANYIGTNFDGTRAIPNGASAAFDTPGVYLSQTSGATIGPRNLISGNDGPGVIIDGGDNNHVFGNYIGTNASGDGPLGNAVDGVLISNSAFNTIGGGDPAERNVISGSRFVFAPTPNPDPATSAAAGVAIIGSGSYGNSVIGNYIGTNATGTAAVPNAYDGVGISGAGNNTIGGPGGERNVISGNGGVGVRIAATPTLQSVSLRGAGISAAQSSGSGNVVVNNHIGTDVNGVFAIPNTWDGIYINAASDNVIGEPGLGNLVSGNLWSGIHINGSSSTRNRVQGNFIGTGANGAGTIANGDWGVLIQDATGNVIGGTGAGTDNVFGLNRNGNTETFVGNFPLTTGVTNGNVVVGNQHRGGGGHAVPRGHHLVRFSRQGVPYRARAARQAKPMPVTPQARPVVGAQHPLFLARRSRAPRVDV